ncbi:small ribosomal subunit biogenesis GTPase RsgA 1, mitochondrial [Malania oleifera]|uniref:small ribosomal subunit biogenesis GTPase RsgA 1, mitochondrial n=1 Tax=Malania oleifera TaxID=397392 RepID=UPI0025AE179A|nr:small ribosomal subunit biogenesis GTPase RsgA 1, mitochondrial [Malania oleifera]
MPIASISILCHRISPVLPTAALLLRRCVSPCLPTLRLLSVAAKQRNPNNVSRKANKNLLKARETVRGYSALAPVLSSPDELHLSPTQAVGMVAAAQANFMRVIVQSVPSEISRDSGDGTEASGSLGKCSDASGSRGQVEGARIGVELLCVVRAVLKKIKRRVLVGDKVLVGSVDWVDRRGAIENVFQRSSEILDPPVTNVDHLLVLFSVDQPKPEAFSLTRFLVEAESTGIPLTLALNKSELVNEETLMAWKSRLCGWGYEPIFCSVESKHGLDTLAFILREQTTVIVGPSGVGKSSLINALRSNQHVLNVSEGDNCFHPIMGSKWFEDQRVGEVSTRSGRGKHTTRNVSLLPLAGGGYLADTPGFNQPSLMKVTKHSLAKTFPEIRKMLCDSESAKCTFNNCLHLGEPGCIIKGDWERYPYYLQLLDEIKIREEFQLRTIGTKRESDVRYKVGDMGVKQAEPRLEFKKHRRQSRKRARQSILEELDELDDDDTLMDAENDPILGPVSRENL